MTPDTQQATRFPAKRLAIVAALVVAVVAAALTAGFLLLREGAGAHDPRQAVGASPDDTHPTATAITEDTQSTGHVDCEMVTFKSLEELVSRRPGADVVLARVEGDPEVWLRGFSGEEISESEVLEDSKYEFVFASEFTTVDVIVQEYLLGEGRPP